MTGKGGYIGALIFMLAWSFSLQHSVHGTERPQVRATHRIYGPDTSPLQMPSDCTLGPQGQLLILDGVNHRAVVYDCNHSFLHTFGEPGEGPGQLDNPLGITIDKTGTVFIADSGNHRVQVFSLTGQALDSIPLPQGDEYPADPTGVVIDSQYQRLYIVDNDNHRLLPYDLTQRQLLPSWGSPGQGRRQFRYPFLLDISSDGYVYIVEPINTRIQVLNPQGKFVRFIGTWGTKAGQLFRPKGIVVNKEHVYVTDSYLGRIQVFERQGDFLGVLTDQNNTPIPLVTPMGLALDTERHRLYVVELKANRVTCLTFE